MTALPLSVVAKTQLKLTVSWTPPAGAAGYVFYRDGERVSNSWNPAKSQVTFGLDGKPHTFRVVAVEVAAEGTVTSDAVVADQPPKFGSALAAWIAQVFGAPWTGEGHLPDSVGRTVAVNSTAELQAALNGALDGDTIELASGVYSNINVSGKIHSPANPVTVKPAAGASVTITTSGSTPHAWYMTGCQGFKLLDLFFDLCNYCAVKLETHVKDIELNGCAMTRFAQINSGHGVLTSYECERIALWNCRTYNGADHGLYLGSQGQPAGTAAFGIKGLLVANHVSYDNYRGTGFASGNSAGFGIQLGDSVVGGRVVNCTCDHNGVGSTGGGGMTLYSQGSVTGDHGQDVEFVNCVTTNNQNWGYNSSGSTPSAGTNHLTYCLGHGNGAGDFYAGSMLTIVGPNFTADPLYADRAGKDFRPSASGPAHEVGDPAWTPAADHGGAARVSADLGAFATW